MCAPYLYITTHHYQYRKNIKACGDGPPHIWPQPDPSGCYGLAQCYIPAWQDTYQVQLGMQFVNVKFERIAIQQGCVQGFANCCHKYRMMTGQAQTGHLEFRTLEDEYQIVKGLQQGGPCSLVAREYFGDTMLDLSGQTPTHRIDLLCGTLSIEPPAYLEDPCRIRLKMQVRAMNLLGAEMFYPYTVNNNPCISWPCYYPNEGMTLNVDHPINARFDYSFADQPLSSPIICPDMIVPTGAEFEVGNTIIAHTPIQDRILIDECSDPSYNCGAYGSTYVLGCGGSYPKCITERTLLSNGLQIVQSDT